MKDGQPISVPAKDRAIRNSTPSTADLAPARRDRRPVTALVAVGATSLALLFGGLVYKAATSGGPNDFGHQVRVCVDDEMAAHPRGTDPAGNPMADSGAEYISDCARRVQAAQNGK